MTDKSKRPKARTATVPVYMNKRTDTADDTDLTTITEAKALSLLNSGKWKATLYGQDARSETDLPFLILERKELVK